MMWYKFITRSNFITVIMFLCVFFSDEPQLMLTAGPGMMAAPPQAAGYPGAPGMYAGAAGAYGASVPGYGM